VPEEAGTYLGRPKCLTETWTERRCDVEAFDQELLVLLGTHFRSLFDVRVHVLSDDCGIYLTLIQDVKVRKDFAQNGSDDVGGKPGDALPKQSFGEGRLPNPWRSAY